MPQKPPAIRILLAVLLPLPVVAQPSRIAARIDNGQRIFLRGNIHPQALPELDQGAADLALLLPRVTLVLKPSQAQQSALDQLLAEQQDPSSANYHTWLTPEQFADRFGASQDDIDKIAAWLQSQALTVTSVARSRNAISFSGSAAAVGQAFGLALHHFVVNGERHFANTTEPAIPAAFAGMVGGVRGLHDFRLKPASLRRKVVPNAEQPDYTSGGGYHYLAPGDIATIYNLKPLLSSGVDGSGQSLVVVGQSQVRLADIQLYRSTFNLPAKDPQLILDPNDTDPGISAGDLSESELDLELAGAAAPNANILFVYSSDVGTSARYAIDQNLAPVLSMSYGLCEAQYTSSDAAGMEALGKQANAQGITWFAASGDSGATDCAGSGSANSTGGPSVDLPASMPEVTGIGGTEFTDGSGTYWNLTNDANGGSAISYIPETAWNDTALDNMPSASGGGASVFFTKPAWQVGPGVPADGWRDVPDIAITASADHDGFRIYSSDGCPGTRGSTTPCLQIIGGTSTGPPSFSGIFTLVNQQVVAAGQSAGLGNINPKLYSLAQSAAAAFHDITTGDNRINVTCPRFSRTPCTPGIAGFSAGPGYDQVTGLGSVDATALVSAWTGKSVGPGGKNTGPAPVITVAGNAAAYNQTYAPGMLLTIFGSNFSPGVVAASSVPLPAQLEGVSATVNNMIAPLWYVSPGQINLQVPYEISANSTATLTLNNNGQSASVSFAVAAAAPGIFTDGSGAIAGQASAERGEVATLFLTGAGAVAPTVADGAAPGSLTPKPVQQVTVTVGGVSLPQQSIKFIGIPQGLVGVTQINYQVPNNAPLGPQPVVVTVGSVSSPPVMLTVTD